MNSVKCKDNFYFPFIYFQILRTDQRAWVGIIPSHDRHTWQWVDGTQFDGPKYGIETK